MEPPAGSIVRLADASLADEPVLGGKAANLGELLAAGFRVPPGFALTADAHRGAMEASGFTAALRGGVEAIDPDDGAALSATSRHLQQAIVDAGMPDALRTEVLRAHRELVGPDGAAPGARVAVRSSAVGEDGTGASYAGVYASFTDVGDGEELIARIVDCWASAHGVRSLTYRVRAGADPSAAVAVAVVVQVMVDSSRSGVAFSRDPTGARDVTVVEAAPGLGEVVAGGLVEPDTWAVRRDHPEVSSERIGHQQFRFESSPGGPRRVDLDDETAAAPVLTHDEVLAVAELARRIEDHHGAPQDVEFAFDQEGTLFVLQARPITAARRRSPVEDRRTGEAHAVRHDDGEDRSQVPLARGVGASPGTAVGRVRVLSTPQDAPLLEPGEVLVTSTTSPDWLPAFRVASAIVTDLGGITSHAAIVSRELGLPAVVGARSATTDLVDGQLVSVDGTSGTVTSAGGSTAV